ncbi:hypothetical protein ANO14919_088820 [Xylariales sp. No.14919]|nr:hypothetical protein ANO14919_088820 [Xylariales sp. No.14919]
MQGQLSKQLSAFFTLILSTFSHPPSASSETSGGGVLRGGEGEG